MLLDAGMVRMLHKASDSLGFGGLRVVDIIGTLNGDVIYDLIPAAQSLIDALMLQWAGCGK